MPLRGAAFAPAAGLQAESDELQSDDELQSPRRFAPRSRRATCVFLENVLGDLLLRNDLLQSADMFALELDDRRTSSTCCSRSTRSSTSSCSTLRSCSTSRSCYPTRSCEQACCPRRARPVWRARPVGGCSASAGMSGALGRSPEPFAFLYTHNTQLVTAPQTHEASDSRGL